MTNQLQTKANSLKSLLQSAKKEIEAALPKHITADRMARIALTEARKIPKLLDCDPASFLGALIQASQLGLEPGGALGHCYLIPYGNQVQFQVGYRGMLELATRSDKVSHVVARAVYEGDQFEWELGLEERLLHKPGVKPGALTHVYAIVFLKNGSKIFDVMSVDEIERVRKSSKAGNSGPWKEHYVEMSKKTVIKRLFKYTPISIEMQTAVGLDDQADSGVDQKNDAFIQASAREVKPSIQELIDNTPQPVQMNGVTYVPNDNPALDGMMLVEEEWIPPVDEAPSLKDRPYPGTTSKITPNPQSLK